MSTQLYDHHLVYLFFSLSTILGPNILGFMYECRPLAATIYSQCFFNEQIVETVIKSLLVGETKRPPAVIIVLGYFRLVAELEFCWSKEMCANQIGPI